MKPLIIILLFLFSFSCFAQKQNVYFLKNNGRYVDNKDSADYTRIVQEPGPGSVLYKVMEYYPNGKLKLEGESSTINPPSYEGTCTTYFKTGIKKAVNHYKRNTPTGNQISYFPNGKIYYTITYPDSINTSQGNDRDDRIVSEYDSLGKPMVVNGNGYSKWYDDKFEKVVDEGAVKNGVASGVWKGHDDNINVDYTEIYNNGVLISGVSTDKDGNSVNYTNSRSTQPEFKDGTFSTYIQKNVRYPAYEKKNNIQGRVILSFIIEKDGKVSNVNVISSVSENIDAEAIRVIKDSPAWIPETMYGRKVRSYFTIPLSFTLGKK